MSRFKRILSETADYARWELSGLFDVVAERYDQARSLLIRHTLRMAIEAGDKDAISKILAKPLPTSYERSEDEPLAVALREGDAEIFELVMRGLAKTGSPTHYGYVPALQHGLTVEADFLYAAVALGKENIARAIIEKPELYKNFDHGSRLYKSEDVDMTEHEPDYLGRVDKWYALNDAFDERQALLDAAQKNMPALLPALKQRFIDQDRAALAGKQSPPGP